MAERPDFGGAGGMLGSQAIGEGAEQSITGSTAAVVLPPPSVGAGGQEMTDPNEASDIEEDAIEAALEAKEQEQFEQIAQELRDQISGIPDLAPLANSLLIDSTPEGLRIQIADQDKVDMFAPGSAQLYPRTRDLLVQVASVIRKMPNKISISGHTDPTTAIDPSGYTNWELSADRALATRRVLLQGGVDDRQIGEVVGLADREPLDPTELRSPRNRRVSIILMRADNMSGDEFNRLPNFLERSTLPEPLSPAASETFSN